MFGLFILILQFVQMPPAAAGYGFAVGVTGAGLFMLPSAAVMLVAGPIAGTLAGRRGSSKLPLLLGTAFAGLSSRCWRWRTLRSGRSSAVTLLGLGIKLSFASMANLIVEAVPQHQTGEATGMNMIMRTVGGAFAARSPPRSWPTTSTHRRASQPSRASRPFVLGAVALGIAMLCEPHPGTPGRPGGGWRVAPKRPSGDQAYHP